ncbi:uncharacterized protein LOC134835019 [Culicoides brevitarsis]|uniref:uncharacterized protein LOC134835019 n=1 Tax=Culicoides brevitarsis TaxID=469753 RepID=UPI00307C5653
MKQRYTKVFQSSSGTQLRVKFTQNLENTLEIEIENGEFIAVKRSRIKWIAVSSVLYLLYIMMAKHFFIANIIFGSTMLILVYTFAGLVKSEKVTLVRNFGLQTCTSFAFGKVSNLLIPEKCLQDVVINEVIYNLKVIYVLDVLTKGSICKEKPIITLFSNLLPNLECLELCYKLMHGVLR